MALTAWPGHLLVLIPVYNHGQTVGDVARGALALGAPVLVVDDGSSDGSAAAAQATGAQVLSLPKNLGKGAALMAGMQWASERGYRAVLTVDADGQHPISELPGLAQTAVAAPGQIIIGVRQMACAPLLHRTGRWCSNAATWCCAGIWPGDSQSGLRVYPLPATAGLGVQSGRYAFEVEVLVRAAWARIGVVRLDVAVLYPADRISHFNKLSDNFRATKTFVWLFGLRWWRLLAA